MLRSISHIRYHIAVILSNHWEQFVFHYKGWIRPVVFENARKVLSCRTPVLIYRCSSCGHVWLIPRRRILNFERFFRIKKGQPFVWECHDCHEGVVIPDPYANMHGEKTKINPKDLDSNTEVICF